VDSGGATHLAFTDVLAQPARAHAGVHLYRAFLARELMPIMRGRYADQRLTVPTRLLLGGADFALRPAMLAGYEQHTRCLQVERVPGRGHFIVDEDPGLIVDRALAFFDGRPL
jgi:pimeloyl-ACP methyl ester carboxylesterase